MSDKEKIYWGLCKIINETTNQPNEVAMNRIIQYMVCLGTELGYNPVVTYNNR